MANTANNPKSRSKRKALGKIAFDLVFAIALVLGAIYLYWLATPR